MIHGASEEGLSRVDEVPTRNREADIRRLRCTPFPLHRACQVAVSPAAHVLSTLSRIDHEDAFIVDVGPDQERTGEQWPERSCKTLRSSPEPRSGRDGWRSACGSVQLGLTDFCSAGRCAAAPGTSRSSLPAPAHWKEEVLAAPAAQAARRHLRAAGEPDRTRGVGRSRARTSTGPATPPRAGQPQAR
jgi:hypothetical protein